MTYTEAIQYIHSVTWKGSRPGLSRITELCSRLGDPQDQLSFVHVAGTNGKGSFCSMLASVLSESGLKVGLFTSPFIKEFNERFRINGENIADDELAEITELVKPHADAMEDAPTEFELVTAIAFEFFRRQKCDVVVLEVGMGGRLDSTNIIKTPALSVITEISLDHTAFLGSTVEAIAAEKAGIIKSGAPVIFTGTDKKALDVVRSEAEKRASAFSFADYSSLSVTKTDIFGSTFDYDGESDFRITLAGEYQPRNAAAVISAVKILRKCGYSIPDSALRRGLEKTKWPARFELLSEDPVIVYDGGHNPDGVRVTFASARQCFDSRPILLSGIMADKDYTETARIAAQYAHRVYTVKPDVPRALDAESYANVYRSLGIDATPAESIDSGVAAAVRDAKSERRPLLIFGSLYMYADVERAVRAVLSETEVQDEK